VSDAAPGASRFDIRGFAMLNCKPHPLWIAILSGIAVAACDRTDRENLRTDGKKLLEDSRKAAKNAAREVKQETKEAAAEARKSLERAGDTAGQIVGDAAITARVKAALLAEKNVKSSAIDVDAFQGKVILRGTVPDREQAALAAKVAAAVEGVKTVDNRLGVH
jgi:osmotically-inducible protein OsmY